MSEAEPIVDAEVVEDAGEEAVSPAHGVELVERVDAASAGTIIRAEQPEEILAKATKIANALADLVKSQDLARNLGGKKPHVEVGAWQALGSLLGAFGGQPLHAETAWSRPVLVDGQPKLTIYEVRETRKKWGKVDGRRQIVEETESEYEVDGHDWEARVEIRTASGVVVGAAEAMCSRSEMNWMSKPDPAVKSMAETRAESRAYRRAVGWIMVIAGYNPTPAEEMPPEAAETVQAGQPFGEAASSAVASSARQAIAWMLGQPVNSEPVTKVLADIERRAGGYLPMIAARAVGHAAAAARTAREKPEPAAVPGDGDPAGETVDEKLEREDAEAAVARVEHEGMPA
jgi:hypothetical protein